MTQRYLSNKIKDEKYLKVKFPDKPVTKDVIDFLESQGFLEISYSYNNRSNIIEAIEKSGNGNLPLYANANNGMKSYRTIYIFGGGEVTNDNPVFAILTKDDGDINYKMYMAGNIYDNNGNKKHYFAVPTFSEIREHIVDHFNWT